jgi:outer membrane protein OmpA-like peptidoglycan-associated protein
MDALIEAGADQVPRGARVVMGPDFFEGGAALSEGAREPLARLVGILRFGTIPRLRVEGHTPGSGSTSEDLDLSQGRSDAVRDYLVNAGIPAANIVSQGFGASRPALGAEGPADPVNERVEITILEP